MLAFARSGTKRPASPPEGEERLLDGVLGQALVAEDPEGEAVGDPSEPVVELGERRLVGPRDQSD